MRPMWWQLCPQALPSSGAACAGRMRAFLPACCRERGGQVREDERRKGRKAGLSGRRQTITVIIIVLFLFNFMLQISSVIINSVGEAMDIHYLLSTVMESNSVCLGGGAHVCFLALPSSWPIVPRGPPRGPWMVASLPRLSQLSPRPPHGHPQAPLSWPRNPCICLVPSSLPCRPGPILHIRPGILIGEYLFLFVWGALPCSHEGEGESVCK